MGYDLIDANEQRIAKFPAKVGAFRVLRFNEPSRNYPNGFLTAVGTHDTRVVNITPSLLGLRLRAR